MLINRRGLLIGLASALAAPAIVHAENLMPVRRVTITPPSRYFRITSIGHTSMYVAEVAISDDLSEPWRGSPKIKPVRFESFPVGETAFRVGDLISVTF